MTSDRAAPETMLMANMNYRDLIAWQKAMDLVESVYKLTVEFPREEVYGLSVQNRRSAVSIPSNIAEGEGRRTNKEFLRFLSMAHGSVRELETQVLIADRLSYGTPEARAHALLMCAEVGRLITGLSNRLREREEP